MIVLIILFFKNSLELNRITGLCCNEFLFLSHFSTNFERFGAYPAASMLNFLKHTNFFPS